jgi:hypothetical protein
LYCPNVVPQAPNEPTYIEVEFVKGDPVAIDGVQMSPATLLTALNKLGGDNGGWGWVAGYMGRNGGWRCRAGSPYSSCVSPTWCFS